MKENLKSLPRYSSLKTNDLIRVHSAGTNGNAAGTISYGDLMSQLNTDTDDLTSDEIAAINGASSPSGSNVFLTSDDVTIPTYVEVPVSSADILALNSTPKTLLAAPGVGKYYDIDKIIAEYTFNTTNYTYAFTNVINIWSSISYASYGQFTGWLINGQGIYAGQDRAAMVRPLGGYSKDGNAAEYSTYSTVIGNESIFMQAGTSDPTGGDGTLAIKIWYTIRTFGA